MIAYKAGELKGLSVSERTTTVRRPEDLSRWIMKNNPFDDDREAFIAIYLDSRHKILTDVPYVVSVGSLNASLVHPREVFGPAVELRAAAVIVAHNHPSGTYKPSSDDLVLTERLDKAGDLMGIGLLDHLILGKDKFQSIREYGWPTLKGGQVCDGDSQ